MRNKLFNNKKMIFIVQKKFRQIRALERERVELRDSQIKTL